MSIATLTTKWQVTIPSDIRKKLGLKPQERLSFQIVDEGIFIRPVRDLMGFYGAGRSAVKGPEDFDRVRDEATEGMARDVIEEMK